METTNLADVLSELVEAAAAGALADDDAHVIGHTLVFRHPGHDMTVRVVRRRAIAVVDGEPLELDRTNARRIAAAFPQAVDTTAARRARVAERSVHVRVASGNPARSPVPAPEPSPGDEASAPDGAPQDR
jgi:hypothetical protein